MKRIIAFVMLLTASFYSFSQGDEKKQKKYKWGCTVAINSVGAQIGSPELNSWGTATNNLVENNIGSKLDKSRSVSIITRYSIRENILLGLEIGITGINLKSEFEINDIDIRQVTNQNLKQNIYRFIPRIQWNFINNKIFGLHGAFTGNYLLYDRMSYNYYSQSNWASNDSLIGWNSTSTMSPKGFAAGLGFVMGFDIFLNRHFSLGAEFSTALLYYETGGEQSGESVIQNLPNLPIESSVSNPSYFKGTQFTKITPSINISIWL